MTRNERAALIARYENGPAQLREALQEMPKDAIRWRPAKGKWSAHEVIVHCADSETISATRIRYLIGEDEPQIQGYDQDRWAARMRYLDMPLEVSLAQIAAARAWTLPLIRSLTDEEWTRTGTHSEMPGMAYTAQKWLETYAEHLETHASQLRRNAAAWRARA